MNLLSILKTIVSYSFGPQLERNGDGKPSSTTNMITSRQYFGEELLDAVCGERWDEAFRVLEATDIDLEVKAYNFDGETPLHAACAHAHLPMCRSACGGFLSLGALQIYPNVTDKEGGTTLLGAILSGRYEVVEFLLNHCGCDPHLSDQYGHNALHKACGPAYGRTCEDNYKILSLLINKGLDINAKTTDGRTPLHYAIHDDPRKIRLLLDHGARVDEQDGAGESALHIAASVFDNLEFRSYLSEVISELIQHGADIALRAHDGGTPLDRARGPRLKVTKRTKWLLTGYRDRVVAREGDQLAVHELLRTAVYGVQVRSCNAWQGQQLGWNTEVGTIRTSEFMTLLQPFDENRFRLQDSQGMLPLHIAAGNGAPVKVLVTLMFPGACLVQDSMGALPIHRACKTAAPLDRIQFLVETGGVGTLRQRDNDGFLPLHVLLNGEANDLTLQLVEYLVKAYPDSECARTPDGEPPFLLAAASSAPLDVVNLLLQRYVSLNRIDF